MKTKQLAILAILCTALFFATANAQMGMGPRPPELRGLWNPVVGVGAAYQVEGRDMPKTEMEIAVVGTESVEGKPGYWFEMAMKDPREGLMVMKHLMVLDGKQSAIKRMVMQAPGQPPMEMPMTMMQGKRHQNEHPADIRETAIRVGSETVTTPAGTFTCEHYRMKDGSGDVWIAEKVGPYGLVKMTGPDSSMTLLRLVSNAKTRITGTPQKFDPMEMMRRQIEKP